MPTDSFPTAEAPVIAVVAAMQQELAALVAAARAEGPVRTEAVLGRELLHGTLGGAPVVLARSGVGKVAAAATAAVLAQRVGAIIMVGTAGGLGDGVNPGDVVVADSLLQHDIDARPLFPRWELGGLTSFTPDPVLTALLTTAADDVLLRPRSDRGGLAGLGITAPRRHSGLIVSGDQFIATRAASDALRADLPRALAVEMEGAALAQVCQAAGVPFAVARTVSDRADDDAHLDFPRFLTAVAAPYARDIVLRALALR